MAAAISTLDDLLNATDALLHAADPCALVGAFEASLQSFGMTSFILSGFPGKGTGHRVFHCHAALRDWVDIYDGHGLQRDCPLTAHMLAQSGPAVVEAIHRQVAPGSRQAEICGMGSEMGLAHGLMVPVHLRNGDTGGVSVMTAGEIESARERSTLHMMALAFHARYEELAGSTMKPTIQASAREIDVLRWFAEGKSTEDVSELMQISGSTVMFHYRNVAERLGTINRTHTVVEAMRRGLMDAH